MHIPYGSSTKAIIDNIQVKDEFWGRGRGGGGGKGRREPSQLSSSGRPTLVWSENFYGTIT